MGEQMANGLLSNRASKTGKTAATRQSVRIMPNASKQPPKQKKREKPTCSEKSWFLIQPAQSNIRYNLCTKASEIGG
jgi:hypothetical protein